MIAIGKIVEHIIHGKGRVLEEWGSWSSCRECFAEVPLPKFKTAPSGKIKYAQVFCGSCNQPTFPLRVNGAGIFDVKFQDDKTRSINGVWLSRS